LNLIDLKGIEIIAIGGSVGGIKAVSEILKGSVLKSVDTLFRTLPLKKADT